MPGLEGIVYGALLVLAFFVALAVACCAFMIGEWSPLQAVLIIIPAVVIGIGIIVLIYNALEFQKTAF